MGIGPQDSEPPIPPRFRWLKRIVVVAIALMAGLLGLRLWWGHVAGGRLQAELDRYRAAGEPVYLEDFQVPPIPDEENAALLLMEAAATWKPIQQNQMDDPRAYLDSNAHALELVRRAQTLPTADWSITLQSPGISILLPHLSPARKLALNLGEAAEMQHEQMNDSQCVETIRSTFHFAAAVEAPPSMLVVHLVSVGIESLATDLVEKLASTLRVREGPNPEGSVDNPASPDQLENLIRDLMYDAQYVESMRSAMVGERGMYCLDFAQCILEQSASPSIVMTGTMVKASRWERAAIWVFKPLIQMDVLFMARYGTALANAGRERSWPAAKARFPPDTDAADWASGLRLLSRVLVPAHERAFQAHFQQLARRRMAAIALAIRLFEIDHGSRPARLAELVPEYLPLVPADPFNVDGLIQYHPSGILDVTIQVVSSDVGAVRPALSSVGVNGLDESKKDIGDDVVFWLDPPANEPTSRPAATESRGKAGDDQIDVEGDGRNADQS